MRASRLMYLTLALKTSLIAYVVAGAFLSMEDFEFWYYEIALTAALDRAVRAEIARRKATEGIENDPESGTPAAAEPDPLPVATAPAQGRPGLG